METIKRIGVTFMDTFFGWTKSTRSIAVVIVLASLSAALFIGKVSAQEYIVVSTVVIGSYFNNAKTKPDSESEDPIDKTE